MNLTPEQLDQLISQSQKHGDVSNWLQDPNNAGSVNVISTLTSIPKASLPKPDLLHVRNKVLDRISLPTESREGSGASVHAGAPAQKVRKEQGANSRGGLPALSEGPCSASDLDYHGAGAAVATFAPWPLRPACD